MYDFFQSRFANAGFGSWLLFEAFSTIFLNATTDFPARIFHSVFI